MPSTSCEYPINLFFLLFMIHSLSLTILMNKVFLVQMFMNKITVSVTEINQQIYSQNTGKYLGILCTSNSNRVGI